MKKLLYAFLLLATFGGSSCSKDDDTDDSAIITNSYTYDGNVTNITYAAKLYNEDEGVYLFLFSTSESAVYDENKYFLLAYDEVKFDVRCNLNEEGTNDGLPYGVYSNGSTNLYFESSSLVVDDRDDNITTATNNWAQVTKNGTSGTNFTIEFEMTLDGKPFKGSFKGDITKEIPAI